jgi:hypothetical protein
MEAIMTDSTLALEDLRAIRRMVADTRRSTGRHWVYLLVWGVLGVVASVASQLLLAEGREAGIPVVWAVYFAVASLISAWFGTRERDRTRTTTFAGRVLSVAWAAIAATIAALCFAAFALDALPPTIIPGAVALLLATGLCVMGAVLEFRPLYGAAVLWWIGALAMMARPHEAFVIQAVVLLLGYLLPAALLRREVARDDGTIAD